MQPIILDFTPEIRNQTLFLDIAPDDRPAALAVNLRYHIAPGRWFLTVTDVLTGSILLNAVPLVPSGTVINDLLSTARDRLPGTLFLLPGPDAPGTLVWMDRQGGA